MSRRRALRCARSRQEVTMKLSRAGVLLAFPVALSGATLLFVAHELLHGSTRLDRWFGRAAGAVTFWGVHEYEHLFLHHRDESFCTDRDPAAAKLGQSYYSYLFRSVGAN